MWSHNFNRGTAINRPQMPMTHEEIRRVAPSAFAVQPYHDRSERYVYIPTISVIEGMERAGFLPFKASQSRTRIPGKGEFTKHMIRFRHTSQNLQTVGDSTAEVVLINSHDGTSAYKLMAGLFRLVCSNGLVVSDGYQESISIKHFGNVQDAVIDGSTRIVENAPKLLSAVKAWEALPLNRGEQLALAEAAHSVRFEQDENGKTQTPIRPEQLLQPRRSEDNRQTLWHTFNVIQENATKGGLGARQEWTQERGRGRIIRTREVKGIDQDVKLNRALWALAERMAELKGHAV